MKQFAFTALFTFSCERKTLDVQPTADEHVLYDFKTRFPAAKIIDISNQLNGKTDIHFTDADGFNGTAIYLYGIWMISEKDFNSDDFLYAIPREVAKTYIGTGIKNEDYNSKNSYVIEVSRNGLDKKQYEFCCFAPFADGSKKIDNLLYDIVIDEDGTLLTCSHNSFNRSIWWYDMRTSINCVRNKYGNVHILGAVNDSGDNVLFIRDNDIRKGIIVADKGFPPSKIREELSERPDLHFLTPIKRNDVRIKDNDMLSFDGLLTGIEGHVVYKKKQIKGGRYLYAYKDAKKASAEEASYLANAEKKGTFSQESYAKKKEVFGVIVFESDQDLEPKAAYLCYEDRWLLELVFNRYKSDECLDRTDVQGDFSVIGGEFINFISTVATCRIIRKAQNAGLLDKISFGELMDDLSSAWRKTDAPAEPATDDGGWVHTLQIVFDELEALGLSKPAPKPEPKKRGRKPKEQTEQKPKRKRGRPRKDATPSAGTL